MTIQHCILHKIARNKPSGTVTLSLRPNSLKNEGPIVSLFDQLKFAFQRSTSRQYGLFNPEMGDNPIPALIQKQLDGSLGFPSFSHQVMEHFKQQLEKSSEPFSAHCLMVIEELLEQTFVYVFWINHTDAQFIDKDMEVDTLEYINPSKIQFAFKLDVSQWQVDGWDQYLSQIASRGNKELSDAFTLFSGFISSVDVKAQTDEFLSLVDQYVDQQPENETQRIKNKIVEYCIDQDMSGAPVHLDQLSNQLSEENPEAFAAYMQQQKPEGKNEIYTDRAALKKYVRFFGRDKNLSISFSSEMFGDHIVFDENSDELIFKQIPKSLKAQLTRYIKKKSQ